MSDNGSDLFEILEDIPPPAPSAPATASPKPPSLPATLGTLLRPAIDLADRRALGVERPIELPWPSLADQFGGGLWPGLHILVSGTGIGKTCWALQVALHAARHRVPVAYVGLELDEMQVALRLLGDSAHVPWSSLYLGRANELERTRARRAIDSLEHLPFHVEPGHPQGWPASELQRLATAMRHQYPELKGHGSRPILLVLDFLQIIGAEDPLRGDELRERIGRAAYMARHIARTQGIAVLVISSAARDKYGLLSGDGNDSKFIAKLDSKDGTPRVTHRKILRPQSLIGAGKESGDIEYSADTVTALIRWSEEPLDGIVGIPVLVATAKGRATGAGWSELRFDGHRFSEPDDGGVWLAHQLQKRDFFQSSPSLPKRRKKNPSIPPGSLERTPEDDGLFKGIA